MTRDTCCATAKHERPPEMSGRIDLSDRLQDFADRHRLKTRIWVEDGTRIIPGKVGHIYEYDDDFLGVMVIPNPPRKRYWGCLRKNLFRLGFTLVQDGDGEGAATFDPMNQEQARAAIRAAGIKRKRQLSPEQREQRVAFLRAAQESHLAAQERTNARQ